MWRAVAAFVVASMLAGCGGTVFFSTTGNAGNAVITTGTVSVVQLTITNNHTQVTIVTLVNNGIGHTFNFCGNVVNQFPMNTFVSVNFVDGTPCFGVVTVVIGPK